MTVITPCRPAEPHEIPRTARALAETALAHGWEVAVTYSQGLRTVREKRAQGDGEGYVMIPVEKAIDHIAVRMWREGKLVGTWEDGAYSMGGSQYRAHSAAELKRMVAMDRPTLRAFMEAKRLEGWEAA